MVKAEGQLVTFSHGPFAGQMAARAEADAVAEFILRRGVRFSLDAKAEVQARLEASLANDPQSPSAMATVDASLGASARLALAAQLGVNGLWAEACAAAEARARVRGDIAVTGQMLLDALEAAPPPGWALAPLKVFLQEVQIHAGVYAEAYFAVRARARLMVAGSVIPARRDDRGAGFTVKFDYGYAYIWGAGVSGYLDVDLPDVPHVVGVVVDTAISETLRLLPPDAPPQIEYLLRLVIPLAASSAVAVGQALGAPQSEETGAAGEVGDVAAAFLTELRTSGLNLVLTEVLNVATEQAVAVIDRALDEITQTLRERGDAAVVEAKEILGQLDQADSLSDALPVLIRFFGALTAFADNAAGPGEEVMSELAEALTVAAAGAGVLEQLLGRDPMPGFPATSAERVRKKLNVSGTTLTVAQLVEYLGVEFELLDPAALDSVGWLADILGSSAPALIGLLWDLGSGAADPAAGRQLAAQAIRGVVDQLTRQLRPFLDELPDGELKELAVFVEPLLDTVEVALLPLLTADENPGNQQAAQVRDELDALLTGLFGALVVRCLDTVIRPFFARGATQLRQLADRVDRHDLAFAEFFRLANEYDVVFRISEAIVSESLRETAGILELAERSAFNSALDLMEAFVLLPAGAERRKQLAELASTDNPRIGDAALQEQLLDALFVKSTAFAAGMIPPSIRMSTLIAADQGPVPLATLYHDVVAIGESTVAAIEDAHAVATTVGDIVGSLVARGTVTAQQLQQLGEDLKVLIGDVAEIAEQVLQLIKDFSWPIFVTSTGGLGFLVREQFDEFFDAADWLVDDIHARLDRLTDTLIEAAITVAQDVGVLDAGTDDDLGTLEQAVRQRTLGDPNQPGVDLFDGAVHVSHAELATMVANAAFDNDEVRTTIRTFQTTASEQAKTARQASVLLSTRVDDAKQAETALRATLAAQQRDTGFTFGVTVEGADNGQVKADGTPLDVVISGAGMGFVTGPHPLVRVEIGGWPVTIDPAFWQVDAQGHLRGKFKVYADPLLGAPHPFIAEGMVNAAPQRANAPTPAAEDTPSPELAAIRAVEAKQVARAAAAPDPVAFLAQPIADHDTAPAGPPTASDFLPPVLQGAPPTQRFPAILALDRVAMMAAAPNAAISDALASLPGTPETAFISAPDLADLGQGGAPSLVRSLTSGVPDLRVVARARPGYTPVTATVRAVPKQGQDAQTTPAGQAKPLWFVLAASTEPEPEPDHNDAVFVGQDNVPTLMPVGGRQQVSITMRNNGNTTWSSSRSYRLGADTPSRNTTWGSSWQELPRDVPPDQEVTFTFTIHAPATSGATFQWRMVRDDPTLGPEWFGQRSAPVDIALSKNDAVFDSQKVPASVPANGSATVTVRMRNAGTTTWSSAGGYRLGAKGFHFGNAQRDLPSPVPPGSPVDITFSITAPPTATATFQWQMVQGNQWFGQPSKATSVARQEVIPKVTVPNVHHLDQADAGLAIRNAGLVAQFKSTGLPGDTWVSNQSPAAGVQVAKGSTVTCTMQKAPPPPP